VDKGVLVFSKKGDALRFTFTNENGKSDVLSPFAGISSFKALPNEKAVPVTESFYPMYEKAKIQSGISDEKSSRSKNIQDLNSKIMFLMSQLKKTPDCKNHIEYLEKLRRVSNVLDSLPLFYIKQLLDVELNNPLSAVLEFKELVSENYISIIINKDDQISNEIETILLAEQFL